MAVLESLEGDGVSEMLYQCLHKRDELNYGPTIWLPDTGDKEAESRGLAKSETGLSTAFFRRCVGSGDGGVGEPGGGWGL